MKNRFAKDVAIGLGLLVIYVIAGKLGLRLAFINASATVIWPATGIALAVLLLFGYRFWPVIFLGAFFVNITTAGSSLTSFNIALGNTLEAVIGAYLVNRFASGKRAFEQPRNIFKYAALAGVVGTAIAATIGTLTLGLGNLADPGQMGKIWLTWWLGDMGGALLIAPFIIIWSSFHWPKKIRGGKIVELICFAGVLLLVGQIVFGSALWAGGHYPLDFLLVPVMLWAGLRFSRRQTATAIVALAFLAIWGTLLGFGPFATADPDNSLLLLQGFLVVMSVATLTVSALIVEQTQLQEELINYTQQLDEEKIRDESLLASIGEGIVASDKTGKVILVNKAFEDLVGRKEKEILGKPTSEALKMQDLEGREVPKAQQPLSLALASGKKITGSCFLLRKNGGKFFAAITASPIVSEGKVVGAIKIFHDISREKQIDESKSEFVSLASHQLRTPLTVIKWYSSRLIDDWGSPKLTKATQKKYIQKIYSTGERMLDLVTAILNVSKIDLGTLAVEPENIHIEDIAQDVLKELEMEIKLKNLKINADFLKPVPAIWADPKLMRILFQNLFTNAIKYTPKRGRISCDIEIQDGSLLITVADTGVGIPKADKDKIFEKFFRTEAARIMDPNGNGLGMYIVRAIVDVAGGKIWFKSKENRGTTFYVIIPLSGMRAKTGLKGLSETYA